MEPAQPFHANPSRRRETLIPNRGRWSPLSLFTQIHLGEGKLQNKTTGPPGWRLGVGPITLPRKKLQNTEKPTKTELQHAVGGDSRGNAADSLCMTRRGQTRKEAPQPILLSTNGVLECQDDVWSRQSSKHF